MAHYEIQNLRDVHREMARLLVMGMKHVDIAQLLGCDEHSIANFKNSKLGAAMIDKLHIERDESAKDVSRVLKEDAMNNVELLQSIRDNEKTPNKIKVDIAQDLLSRAGYAKVTKTQVEDSGGMKSLVMRAKERVVEKGLERRVEREIEVEEEVPMLEEGE